MATPIGGIIWTDSLATIPANYALCDGTGGTPNLIDLCVVCVGSDYSVGDTGVGGLGTDRTHDHAVGTVVLKDGTGGSGSGLPGSHDWSSTVASGGATGTSQNTVVTGNHPEYDGAPHSHAWSSAASFTGNIPLVTGGEHGHPLTGTYATNERRIPLPQVCALYPIIRMS